MAAQAQYCEEGYHDEVTTNEIPLRPHVSSSNHERISQLSLGLPFNTLRASGLLGIGTALLGHLLQVVHQSPANDGLHHLPL